MIRTLERSFYTRPDVVRIARDLLGKVLITEFDGARTAAIITETEAYAGVDDRASHAHGGRHTARTAPMYAVGGTAYVYLCYGIHHMFNVVTNKKDVPHAVLLRAVHVVEGSEVVAQRRLPAPPTTRGPGTSAQAMGIRTAHSGLELCDGPIRIEDHGLCISTRHLIIGPRVGVDYAGPDALRPYRFRVAPSWAAGH